MSKLGLPVTIEPDSEAWHFAWAALARDLLAGDTTGFALEQARYVRDGNGQRILSVTFRFAEDDRTIPIFINADTPIRRPSWWKRLLW